MSSYRQFWGCEVPSGAAGKEVSVEDGDRLNVCQVRPAACCPRARSLWRRAAPPESRRHAPESARQRRGCL